MYIQQLNSDFMHNDSGWGKDSPTNCCGSCSNRIFTPIPQPQWPMYTTWPTENRKSDDHSPRMPTVQGAGWLIDHTLLSPPLHHQTATLSTAHLAEFLSTTAQRSTGCIYTAFGGFPLWGKILVVKGTSHIQLRGWRCEFGLWPHPA